MSTRTGAARSSVQIEVIDEEEYAAEVAQEQEITRQKREAQRQRATAAAAAASSAAPSAAASSSAPAVVTPAASASPWLPLLSSLSLPPLFATLHDLRVYDPPALTRAMRGEVPAFQREAAKAWKQILQALEALPVSSDADQSASITQLRPILTPLVCACIRFMLPALPPPPTPLVSPSLASSDPDLTPPSLAEQAPSFEFVWQTPETSALAASSLQQLARIFRREWEPQTDAIQPIPVDAAAPRSDAVAAIMRDPAVQRFLSWLLPTHLLPFLRSKMRSGPAGSSAAAASAAREANSGGTAAWKSAAHFPSAFFVCFLCAHLSPPILSAYLRSLLALVLPLLDDHELHYKVAGLVSVQRLVRFVPPMLFGEGWGTLLLQSLKASLAFKEPPVLALAVPTYVQAYMGLFPAVTMQDEETLHQLAPRAETRKATVAVAISPSSSSKRGATTASSSSLVSASAPTATLELQDRVAAQEAMLSTLLRELSYLSLSPTLDHLFATFVYAQTLLPVLLYIPPPILVRQTSELLPIVLQWCARFRMPVQRRVARYGWELLEAWLSLGTPGARLAQHLGRIVEACAQGWIIEMESEDEIRAARASNRSRTASSSVPPRTDRVPPNDPDFAVHYTSQPTIVHVLQLLRGHAPLEFEELWRELRAVPELNSMIQAVDAAGK